MTENRSPALDAALGYHRAWTGHDFDRAMTFIAEDIVCDAPAGRIEGMHDGKIAHIRIVFDRTPFEAARRAVAAG